MSATTTMDRRPSAVSFNSSSSSGGLPKLAQLPSLTQLAQPNKPSGSSPWLSTRSASLHSKLDSWIEQSKEGTPLDPDELFTKYTVGEVKTIQQRLRSDADAKQQELRLMVGERYRDLLQASTSIISIAQSSNDVLSSLREMSDVASSAHVPQAPQAPSAVAQEDAHLQALQSLSAHMKLLLDAPEHLWRLIGDKMYLKAGWLFLLARVVHRALLRDEEEETNGWNAHGIDVSEHFPLVQRQWDTVAQFRSQILHKATLSLRECSPSPSDVCSTLLTLHLLESRPLHETLVTLLSQRSKTLTSLLSPTSKVANGTAPGAKGDAEASRSRKRAMEEAKQRMEVLFDLVARTLGTSRRIFMDELPKRRSMMAESLEYIQSESPDLTDRLPPELRLTTQTLLTGLPSSTHFALLPPNIRSYKPYVDSKVTSGSAQLNSKLEEWFHKSVNDIHQSLERCFSELGNIRDVWKVRCQLRRWIETAEGLQSSERVSLHSILDAACGYQIATIWKSTFSRIQDAFQHELASALSILEEETNDTESDTHPVRFLFRPPPAWPTTQGLSTAIGSSAFQKYTNALRRQSEGRTPLLSGVIDALENPSRVLREDLREMKGKDDASRALQTQLVDSYRSDAESLCTAVADTLESSIGQLSDTSACSVRRLVFVGRVASELCSTSSLFQGSTTSKSKVLDGFRTRMHTLYDSTLTRWQNYTVTEVVRKHWPPTDRSGNPSLQQKAQGAHIPRPSPIMMDALLSLSVSIQQLGTPTISPHRKRCVEQSLRSFGRAVVVSLRKSAKRSKDTLIQDVWDLTFLQLIIKLWDSGDSHSDSPTDSYIKELRDQLISEGVSSSLLDVDNKMSEYLFKTQVLIATLLPPITTPFSFPSAKGRGERPSHLLQYGTSSTDLQSYPALNLVKPSPRFGPTVKRSSALRSSTTLDSSVP